MEEHFDINQALRAFNKIVTHGVEDNDNYNYQGITAWSDFDGYTLQLSDEDVSLSIYFHNKYEFDYANSHQLKVFINKLKAIDESIS